MNKRNKVGILHFPHCLCRRLFPVNCHLKKTPKHEVDPCLQYVCHITGRVKRSGVQRSSDARGKILDCITPYQNLALRNVRNTGTAKLPLQTFATCKMITLKKLHLKREGEKKNYASLVQGYATIERNVTLMTNGRKTQKPWKSLKNPYLEVLSLECCSGFLRFSSEDLGFSRFYCVAVI